MPVLASDTYHSKFVTMKLKNKNDNKEEGRKKLKQLGLKTIKKRPVSITYC